jgi:nicotinamidase-related amidase
LVDQSIDVAREEQPMIAIDPARTALLAMDLQTEVVARLGERGAPLLERAARVIAAARQARLPVIYVVVGFRPGYPELSPSSPLYELVAKTGRLGLGTPGAEIAAAVRPEEGDVVVVKRRVSAFAGTDLEVILRAKGIDTLVLLGIATGGVILSTVRHGADADYRLVVVKDCCADADEEVHRVLTEKVLARQATVVAADEAAAAFRAA